MQKSQSPFFAIPVFTICIGCNDAAKVLVSPEQSLQITKSGLKLSFELFSELIHHFQMQRYVVFFRPGRRGIPCKMSLMIIVHAGNRSNVCLSVCLSFCLTVCLSVCLSACLCMSLFLCLFVSLLQQMLSRLGNMGEFITG